MKIPPWVEKKQDKLEHRGSEFEASVSATKWELIQQLIPLGLEAVRVGLEAEVEQVVGPKHRRRDHALCRWGSHEGSVFLGDSKVRVRVPRVRNVETNEEWALESYRQLQKSRELDETVFRRVLKGLSQRDYEKAALQAPGVFGIKKSAVSKRFIRSSAKRLKEFFERRFDGEDFVCIFIDGKKLLDTMAIVALGIRGDGTKVILSFIEASTENHRVVMDFLRGLKGRGLNLERETLFIIDGSKGLRKGITEIFGEKAFIQRCQWHKRENVVAHLPEKFQESFRKKLQRAYEKNDYGSAKRALLLIQRELKWINESAARSLKEGLEETLKLHRLGVFAHLGASLKTTNPIENVNRQLERLIGKVCVWKNSNQRPRWVASASLEIEPRLRKIKGHQLLSLLRSKMKNLNEAKEVKVIAGAA